MTWKYDAARFIAVAWNNERKCRRRRPDAFEVVAATSALAKAIVEQNKHLFRHRGRGFAKQHSYISLAGSSASEETAMAAKAALRLLEEAGDDWNGAENNNTDRLIVRKAIEQVERDLKVNDTQIARDLERASVASLRGGQVQKRRLERCERILTALHDAAPDIWTAKARPVEAAKGNGRVLKPVAAEAVLAA